MIDTTAAATKLTYQVHVSAPIPYATTERVPNGDRRMFSPIASTLISGASRAVLVDPAMTTEQAERIATWVQRSGKQLTHIFVTHGHGDHWFGTPIVLQKFPGATVLASPGTIELMRFHASEQIRRQLWDASFPGQIPNAPVVAQPPQDGRFELEGHELRVVELGHADTDNVTALHVPSLGLVVPGDAVYNGVHQYLVESTGGGLEAWLSALDKIESLQPQWVVAGHKNKALPDDPKTIAQTRRYLLDAKELLQSCHTDLEFFHAMLERHPDRLNPGALWWAARTLFKQPAG